MPKFHGSIGFSVVQETSPGVYQDEIVEREYSGNIIRNTRRYDEGKSINDNLLLNNQFSILGDIYTYANYPSIRYVKYFDTKWKVTNIEVQRPRILLTVGGVYNG